MTTNSAALRRIRAARDKINYIIADLNALDDQLSFIEGDELGTTASDSVGVEISTARVKLGIVRQWINNAVDTISRSES